MPKKLKRPQKSPMVVSLNRGTQIQTPIYYNPYYLDPQNVASTKRKWQSLASADHTEQLGLKLVDGFRV